MPFDAANVSRVFLGVDYSYAGMRFPPSGFALLAVRKAEEGRNDPGREGGLGTSLV